MYQHKQAFTLIELLVVVLIIGILAAVALPQYRLAVLKTRATQAWIGLNALEKAEQAYYLANGEYSEKIDELDITLPETVLFQCSAIDTTKVLWCQVSFDPKHTNWEFNGQTRRFESSITPQQIIRYCLVSSSDDLGNKLCRLYGGNSSHSSRETTYYSIDY